MKTTVVNLRSEPYDVFIGRPGYFGNQYSVQEFGRMEAIGRFNEAWGHVAESHTAFVGIQPLWAMHGK